MGNRIRLPKVEIPSKLAEISREPIPRLIELAKKAIVDPQIRQDIETLKGVATPHNAMDEMAKKTKEITDWFDGLSDRTKATVRGSAGSFRGISDPHDATGRVPARAENAMSMVLELWRVRNNPRMVAPEDVEKIEKAKVDYQSFTDEILDFVDAQEAVRSANVTAASQLVSGPSMTQLERVPLSDVARYEPSTVLPFESIGNIARSSLPEGVTARYRMVGNKLEPVDVSADWSGDPMAPTEYWRTGDVVWDALKQAIRRGDDIVKVAGLWKQLEYSYRLPKIDMPRRADFEKEVEYDRAVREQLTAAILEHPYLSRFVFPETSRLAEPDESRAMSRRFLPNLGQVDHSKAEAILSRIGMEDVESIATGRVRTEVSSLAQSYLVFLQKAGGLSTSDLVALEAYYESTGKPRPLNDRDMAATVYVSIMLAGPEYVPANLKLAMSVFGGESFGDIFRVSVGPFGNQQGRIYSASMQLGQRVAERLSVISPNTPLNLPEPLMNALAEASRSHVPNERGGGGGGMRRRPPLYSVGDEKFDSSTFRERLIADIENNRSQERVAKWLAENADIFGQDWETRSAEEIADAAIDAISSGEMAQPVRDGFADQFEVGRVMLDSMYQRFRTNPNYNPELVDYLQQAGFVLPDWFAGMMASQHHVDVGLRQRASNLRRLAQSVYSGGGGAAVDPLVQQAPTTEEYWRLVAASKPPEKYYGSTQPLPGEPLSRPRIATDAGQMLYDLAHRQQPLRSDPGALLWEPKYRAGIIDIASRAEPVPGSTTGRHTLPQDAIDDARILVRAFARDSGLSLVEADRLVSEHLLAETQRAFRPVVHPEIARLRESGRLSTEAVEAAEKEWKPPGGIEGRESRSFVRPKEFNINRVLEESGIPPIDLDFVSEVAKSAGRITSLREKMVKSGKSALEGKTPRPDRSVTETARDRVERERKERQERERRRRR